MLTFIRSHEINKVCNKILNFDKLQIKVTFYVKILANINRKVFNFSLVTISE